MGIVAARSKENGLSGMLAIMGGLLEASILGKIAFATALVNSFLLDVCRVTVIGDVWHPKLCGALHG